MSKRRRLFDPVCKQCNNIKICTSPCPFALWVNGKVGRVEPLANKILQNIVPQSDYNETISELIADKEARDIDRLETIRHIPEIKKRAVYGLILIGLTQSQISELLSKSQQYISKIFNGK